MRRREFIRLLGGAAAAWPLAARAQQSGKIYRIGFLANDPAIPAQPAGRAFLDGLRFRSRLQRSILKFDNATSLGLALVHFAPVNERIRFPKLGHFFRKLIPERGFHDPCRRNPIGLPSGFLGQQPGKRGQGGPERGARPGPERGVTSLNNWPGKRGHTGPRPGPERGARSRSTTRGGGWAG
jgi:hypothetical protein